MAASNVLILPGTGGGIFVRPFDQAGPLSDLGLYDAQAEGFTYAADDQVPVVLYQRRGPAGMWIGPVTLQGPQGPVSTLVAGATQTLAAGAAATAIVTDNGDGTFGLELGLPRGADGTDGKPAVRSFADRAALDAQKASAEEPIVPGELVEVASYDGKRSLVRCEYDAGQDLWTDRPWPINPVMSPEEIRDALNALLGADWQTTGTGQVAVSASLENVSNGDYDVTGLFPADMRIDHIELNVLGSGTADVELLLATANLATFWPLGDVATWPVAIGPEDLTAVDITAIATNRHLFGRGAATDKPRRVLARVSGLSGNLGAVDVLVSGIVQAAVDPSVDYPLWAFSQDFDALPDGAFDGAAAGMNYNGTPLVGASYGRSGKGVRCEVLSGADRLHSHTSGRSEIWGQIDFRVQATAARTIPFKLASTRASDSAAQAASVALNPANELVLVDFAGTPALVLASTFTVVDDVWHTLKYGLKLSATPEERVFYLAVEAEGSAEVVLFDGQHLEAIAPGTISRWMVGCIANGTDTVELPVDVDNYNVQFSRPATFAAGA